MSLKWKTAILIFIVSLVIIPVSVEYLLRAQSAQLLEQQTNTHQRLLKKMALMARDILSSEENIQQRLSPIKALFSQYAALPQYEGFYLYQNEEVIVAHEDGASLPENFQKYEYIQPVVYEDDIFILMLLSPEQVLADYLIFSNSTWFVLLVIIFLLALIGYITGNRLAQKVDELIVGISKAGGGNYSQRISVSGNDEVAQLVISYNRMLDNMVLSSQEVKEQLENYKNILCNAVEGIISINERGVIQRYNQSAGVLFGYDAEEMIGKNISRLIPAKIPQENGDDLVQDFVSEKDNSTLTSEVIGVRKNEQNFPIELSVSGATINNMRVYTGIIRDITDKKENELKQKDLERQLRRLQRQTSLESMSGGIAHDFNNILGPVLGYADMAIADAEEGSKTHRYLTRILNGAHRARKLVARIMSFSRQSEQDNEQLHLTTIVEDSLELLRSSLPAEQQLKTFFNTTNDVIAAERTQISQVLVALVTNASQAMVNSNGILTIRLDNVTVDEELIAKSSHFSTGEYVRLRIQDTGIGMNTITKEKIFEPFFSTSEQENRTGLGLSVAHRIITGFGGDILVSSEVGSGSEFSIYLPVIDNNLSHVDITTAVTKRPLSKSGELILYIDDDAQIAELGKEMLENLGYEVETSVSSENALEVFRSDSEYFDLVITDQSMPVLTGTQLARELKRIRSDIPVILVSGFSASILNRELVDSGIDHCIAKPLVMDELGKVVLEALTESR